MGPNKLAVRIKSLLSIFSKKQRSRPKTRRWKYKIWLFIYIVIAIGIVPSFFIKSSNMLVKIQLTVSDVSFDFLRKEGHPLFNDILVKKARFVHFKKFIIPFDKLEETDSFCEENLNPTGFSDEISSREITVLPLDSFSSIIFDDIRFSELYLEKNARMTLSMIKNNEKVANILIDRTSTSGRIDIRRKQCIECQYCQFSGIPHQLEKSVNYLRIFNEEQKKIDFLSSEKSLHLTLELEKNQVLSEDYIYIKNPSFVKQVGQYQMTSIVKTGKIVLKDMADKEIPIEPHDFVTIEHTKALQVTRMEFQDDGIQLVFIGKVNGLKTGTKENLTNKLPAWVDVFRHKHLLLLYLYIVAIVFPSAIISLLKLSKSANENKKIKEGDES